MSPVPASLLNVEELKVYFRTAEGPIRAVDGVSFYVHKGETVALVGESGCGKSVTALSLARLLPHPGYIAGGHIRFSDRDVMAMNAAQLGRFRGAEIAYIFQEPSASLNPVFRVGYQIAEAIRLHRQTDDCRAETIRLMNLVGLPDAEHRLNAYPQELSGGMQQRIMIAMALACSPKLLVADEPTTALDVTIQAQILDLLIRLQKQLDMAIILITHNLGLVADSAHRVCVMYAGRIVETGLTEDLLTHPLHPYTRGLLDAVPRLKSGNRRVKGIAGTVPNPSRLPPGCKFHPRCPKKGDYCVSCEPELLRAEGDHWVRCHFWK